MLHKDLIAKSNEPTANEFLQQLTSVVKIVFECKVAEGMIPFFFGTKPIGLHYKHRSNRGDEMVADAFRRILENEHSYEKVV